MTSNKDGPILSSLISQNTDKREAVETMAGDFKLDIALLSVELGDGIATTAIHGPERQGDIKGRSAPFQIHLTLLEKSPERPSSDGYVLVDSSHSSV